MKELPKKVVDKERIKHKVWIVATPSSAMQYINDNRDLPGDSVSQTGILKKPRANNVQFLQASSASSFKELSSFRILSFQQLRSTTLGVELLVH